MAGIWVSRLMCRARTAVERPLDKYRAIHCKLDKKTVATQEQHDDLRFSARFLATALRARLNEALMTRGCEKDSKGGIKDK